MYFLHCCSAHTEKQIQVAHTGPHGQTHCETNMSDPKIHNFPQTLAQRNKDTVQILM